MKKRNTVFLAFLLLFFTGCGGGGGGSSTVITQRDVSPYNENTLFYQQWYFAKDNAFYADNIIDDNANIHPWPTTQFAGRGVKVAIIDDALDTNHEDIKDGIVATFDVESRTSNVYPRSVDENHGTEVTGVALAGSNGLGISGIAPAAQIYFIRMPFNVNLTESMIIEAFAKAKEWGVDVVNCSWGSGNVSDAVRAAIVDLARNGRGGKGTVIVFAAGNGGDDGIGDPIGNDESSIPEVIAVGATNKFNQRTEYSNYGSELDVMAPGGEYIGITTTDRTGVDGNDPGNYVEYNSRSAFGGTSAAAPIITGVSALLLEADYNLTRIDVMRILEDNADKIDTSFCNYDTNGHSDYCGYGKVNVTRAIKGI